MFFCLFGEGLAYVKPFFYCKNIIFYKKAIKKFAYVLIYCNFTTSNKTKMKDYSLIVWYRYVSYGEEQKDFDVFTVEALGIHDAFKKIKKLHFQGNKRIPTSYAINVQPFQWYKPSWLVSCVNSEDTNKPLSEINKEY